MDLWHLTIIDIFRAVQEQDPYKRMINIVRFYLSGFYKKPKGLKKPYNPILGEQFRCYFAHPDGTKTYYVAEQVRFPLCDDIISHCINHRKIK